MGKKVGITIGVIVGMLVIIVACIPAFLSSSLGKGIVEGVLSRKVRGDVTIKKVDLSWSGPQKIEGVTVKAKTYSAECQEISSKGSLFASRRTFDLENGAVHASDSTITISKGNISQNELFVSGISEYAGNRGDFEIDLSYETRETGIVDTIHCSGALDNVPIGVLDAFATFANPKWEHRLVQTLGPVITGHFDITYGPQTLKSHTDLHTPNLSLLLNTFPEEEKIAITPTSKLTWHFGNEDLPYIENDVTLEVSGKDLLLDPSQSKWSLASLSGSVICNISPASFDQGITLLGTTITLSTKEGTSAVDTTLGTKISYGKTKAAPFYASLEISDIFDPLRSIRSHTFFEHVRISTTQFPMPLLDALTKSDGFYTKYFGPMLNFTFEPNGETIYCHLETPRLSIDDMHFRIEELARLNKPAHFTYDPPQNLGKSFSASDTRGIVNELAFPLSPWGGNLKSSFFKTEINPAYLSYDEKDLSLAIQNPTFSLTGNGFKHIEGKSAFMVNITHANQMVEDLIGPSLQCQCDTIFDLSNFANISAPQFDMLMTSNRMNGRFDGKIKNNFQTFSLESPFELKLQPPSTLVNSLLAKNNSEITYLLPSPIDIVFQPTTFTLKAPDLAALAIDANLSIPELQVTDHNHKLLYTIIDTKSTFITREQNSSATFTGYAEIVEGAVPVGKLHFDLQTGDYTSFDVEKIDFAGTIKAQKFSSQAADHLLGISPFFTSLAGDDFNAVTTLYSTYPAKNFKIDFDSFQLSLSGHFIDDQTFHLASPSEPCKISGELTPSGLDLLLKHFPRDIRLIEKTKYKGEISHLDLPKDFDLKKTTLSANLSSSKIRLSEKVAAREAEIYKPHLIVDRKNLNDPLALKFDAEVKLKASKAPSVAGKINADLKLGKNGDHNISVQTRNFPTMLADFLLYPFTEHQFPLADLLGPAITSRLNVDLKNWSGPLELTLDSKEANATASGDMKHGILHLTKPLKASLTVTQALGNQLLKDMNLSFIDAKDHITLTIPEEGTAIPVHPFALKRCTLPKFNLNLGKITCRNRGTTSDLSSIFKLTLGTDTAISLWFAPLEGSLKRGMLGISRTEILYNNLYEIATWGSVDLDHRYIDMVLGLTAGSLDRALGIKNLPDNFVLTIPFQGPFGKAHLETDIATAKLAMLFARDKNLRPKSQGWGALFDALGTLAEDQSHVPPPRPPYPWSR